MDEFGKIVFLNALIRRKEQLFDNPGKLPWDEKQKLWVEIYDECAAAGCIGLVSAEHLRKTTWQNLQRRARFRYEKSLSSEYLVKFTKVDKLVLDIIGRENVRECFLSDSGSHFNQFNDNEKLEGEFKLAGENVTTPTSSGVNEYSYADDTNHCQITQENFNELNSVLLSNAVKLEQSRNVADLLDDDHPGMGFHAIELPVDHQNQSHSAVTFSKRSKDFPCKNKATDGELLYLKKEKIKAKIEKLRAESAKLNAEARLITAEAMLKESETQMHNPTSVQNNYLSKDN